MTDPTAPLPDPASPSPVPTTPDGAPAAAPAPTTLPVLFQDRHLVAISKPSGLLVHRDEHNPDAPAVLQILRDQLDRFLYPVHRLDRATSGILVYAFSREDAAALQASMGALEAHKEYVALVRWPGSFPELGDRWVCDRPLHDDKDVPRAAHSEFWLQESFRRAGLIGCRIATGRFHQIRRHLNHCGRHVLGDTTHGKGRLNALYRERYGLNRLFLHAGRLRIVHPRTGDPLELEDPLPKELEAVVERLRAESSSCPPPPPPLFPEPPSPPTA
ncbi:MAG: RluA family pseudouridine synthase [Planctomycetota bacterium]